VGETVQYTGEPEHYRTGETVWWEGKENRGEATIETVHMQRYSLGKHHHL